MFSTREEAGRVVYECIQRKFLGQTAGQQEEDAGANDGNSSKKPLSSCNIPLSAAMMLERWALLLGESPCITPQVRTMMDSCLVCIC